MSRLRELLDKSTHRPWTAGIIFDHAYATEPSTKWASLDPLQSADSGDVFTKADVNLIVTLVNAGEEIADLMEASKKRHKAEWGSKEFDEAVIEVGSALRALDKKLDGGGR